jgi:RNA polymerase sigma-70 factor (ECF subfamily)
VTTEFFKHHRFASHKPRVNIGFWEGGLQGVGIEARFNSILQEYGRLLRNAIASRCPKDLGLSFDDIFQEASLRLWRALSSEGEIADPGSYLQRIAATATIDAIRRIKARREEQMGLPEGQDSELEPQRAAQSIDIRGSPEAVAGQRQLIAIVQTVLKRLSESRQRAVRLHLQGLTTVEIAELMAWSEAKTRNLVYRGLHDLRSQLRAHGFDYEIVCYPIIRTFRPASARRLWCKRWQG